MIRTPIVGPAEARDAGNMMVPLVCWCASARALNLTLEGGCDTRPATQIPSPGVSPSPIQGGEWAVAKSAAMIIHVYLELSHSSA
jgi:hypothetical protein